MPKNEEQQQCITKSRQIFVFCISTEKFWKNKAHETEKGNINQLSGSTNTTV